MTRHESNLARLIANVVRRGLARGQAPVIALGNAAAWCPDAYSVVGRLIERGAIGSFDDLARFADRKAAA